MNAKELLEFVGKNDVKQVDLRFIDLPGVQQHCTYPIAELNKGSLEEGFGFDGSSIRGWQAINESDMLLIPDPETAFVDPFCDVKTIVIVCDAIDPITRQPYGRDSRWVARKAELYLKNSHVGDTAYFGAESEFFVFDSVRFDTDHQHSYYFVDSDEGR
jgi:glutamine synthetase